MTGVEDGKIVVNEGDNAVLSCTVEGKFFIPDICSSLTSDY